MSYYEADGLRSTMVLPATGTIDSDGDVARDYQYDVYGAETRGTGSLANVYTVITDQAGKVVTSFPGVP